MAIDASIPLQVKGLQLDNPLDVASKVMSMKQLARQGQMQDRQVAEEEDIRNAFRKNVIVGEDGKTTLNKPAVLSDLYKKNPAKAIEAEQQFKKMDEQEAEAKLKQVTQQTEVAKQLAWSISDPVSYEQARQTGLKLGLPNADKLPAQYPGDGFIQQMQMRTLTASEQLAQQWKQKEFQQKEREISGKKAGGESLPLDAKKTVETLSVKNANKISIKNQIDAVIAKWPTLTDSQRLQQGNELIKTLNSKENSDAVGVEEVNRLAAKLQFAKGNLFNDKPMQFGRDLEGFFDDVQVTASTIGTAVESNQKVIDKTMGRKSAAPKFEPDVEAYAKKYNISNEQAAAIKAQRTQTAGQ